MPPGFSLALAGPFRCLIMKVQGVGPLRISGHYPIPPEQGDLAGLLARVLNGLVSPHRGLTVTSKDLGNPAVTVSPLFSGRAADGKPSRFSPLHSMGGLENEKIHHIHNPVCCYVPCGIGWNIQLVHLKIILLNWPGSVIAPGRVHSFLSKPKRPQGVTSYPQPGRRSDLKSDAESNCGP